MRRIVSLLTPVLLILISIALLFSSCESDDPEVNIASAIEILSNGSISGVIGSTIETPIEILIKDQNGDAFAGAEVTFYVEEGSVSVTNTKSDEKGMVSVSWTLGTTEGTQTLTVNVLNADGTDVTGSPFTITATATALPEIKSIEVFSGADQTGDIEAQLGSPIIVIAKDQYGNGYAGIDINFSVTEGSVSSTSATTDSNGKASITWTTGATEGAQTLTATAFKEDGTTELSGSPLTISCSCIIPLQASKLIVERTAGAHLGLIGETIPYTYMVLVYDQNEDLFEGTTVHFSVTEGSVLYPEAVTNANGLINQIWTLGSTEGLQTLTISAYKADGTTHIEGSPVTVYANACNTVTDVEGNVYKTLTYGNQEWMVENLKTTHYNDGTEMTLITDDTEWMNTMSSAYCWYDNDETANSKYGALYNWFTTYEGDACPTGWHVPSESEWDELRDYLIANGFNFDGTTTDNKIAKAMAYGVDWYPVGQNGTISDSNYPEYKNRSGFTAQPGGTRTVGQQPGYPVHIYFRDKGYITSWWTSNGGGVDTGNAPTLWWDQFTSLHYYGMMHKSGLPIRCVKDSSK